MKIRKVLLVIVSFLLMLSIGVISNAETVMRDADIEVNYDSESKPNEIEIILTLKNGAVLLGDINGDGYVNDKDYEDLKNIIENPSLTFEELFETDATRAKQSVDIANRGELDTNETIVIDEEDLKELDNYLNPTSDDFGYFGMETKGTLTADSVNYKRVNEGVSEGETKYKITVTCDSLLQMRKTIGISIKPNAIGYVGEEPYKNDTALEYIYTIGKDQKDSSITLSDGVKNGNKVVFDINAPEGTQVVETEDDFEPVELKGTLVEKASYEIVKDENSKLKIEVTLSEETEGTIGVTLKEMSLVTKDNKTNNELSKMFTVEKQPTQDDEEDKEEVKLKVLNKDEEKQKDGKVKVTLTLNKELNVNKLPKGWEVSKDKKSISKVMEAGATEKIELVAVDGTELNYEVKVTKSETDGTKTPDKLPQAGLGTTLTFAVVVVAGIALISLKKYRDFKDIK